MDKLSQNQQGPTTAKERHVILDALRGLALLGIALANFPEFALWTFLSADEQQAMATAGIDGVVRYMQYLLVDGKFYTIFSLLFGVGFSLILAVIGFCHLMFIWSGDILLLYAVSVVPMALGYVTAMCLWYQRRPSGILFTFHYSLFTSLAAPGRMALSNYISQSLVGVLLFYGLGFGLGCSFGLVYVELTALAVFVLQIVVCKWWLRYFRFGPLEWVWRMLTYGRYFQFKVTKEV